MRGGERQRFLVGTGHGACTCQGAAFEYIVNLEFELRARKVRDKADVVWISNEYELGDFGMGGVHITRGGYITPSKIFTESLFAERGIRWIPRAHVAQVEPGRISYETLEGHQRQTAADFAMLLPPFAGVGLTAIDKAGLDITSTVFQPSGFMKVDADYTRKALRDVERARLAEDLPVAGVPQPVRSGDRVCTAASHLAPAPDAERRADRAGTAAHGDAVGHDRQGRGAFDCRHDAWRRRTDAARVDGGHGRRVRRVGRVEPVHGHGRVDDGVSHRARLRQYPQYGRDLGATFGEIGLAGHWIKILLHHLFIYKARMRPGWQLIAE